MTDPVPALESEVKVEVDDDFRVPDLPARLEVTVATAPETELVATYYDTADLRLARWGATLRYRAPTEAPGHWTVKLPTEDRPDPVLSRQEIDFAGEPGEVPTEAARLVRGLTRRQPLAAVAELTTLRRRHLVLAHDGRRPLAEIDDDRVRFHTSSGRKGSFREIEVELQAGGRRSLLTDIRRLLLDAGGRPGDDTPKVVRALGELPPAEVGDRTDDDSTLGGVVTRALAGSVHRLLANDPGVRLGADPEAVHQARVATRRLRSDLSTLSHLVDREWAAGVRAELKGIGARLGAVRDADVLIDRLRTAAEELPVEDQGAAAVFVGRLDAERDDARSSLLAYLDSDEYVDVLEDLLMATDDPRVTTPGVPAAEALRPLVAKRWRAVKRRVRRLGGDPADDDLHKVRIDIKRCRYAAELAAPVFGRPARQFAKGLAAAQGVLGDLQDAAVAERWLRGAASQASADEALVAGQLVALERAHRAGSRQAWPGAWRALQDARLSGWLD